MFSGDGRFGGHAGMTERMTFAVGKKFEILNEHGVRCFNISDRIIKNINSVNGLSSALKLLELGQLTRRDNPSKVKSHNQMGMKSRCYFDSIIFST